MLFARLKRVQAGDCILASDTAVVLCGIEEAEEIMHDDTVVCIKTNQGSWRIRRSRLLRDIGISIGEGDLKNEIPKTKEAMSSFSAITGSILIPEKHPGTRESDNAYTIHRALTDRYLGHDLFVNNSLLNSDAVTTDLSGWEVGFTLDHEWERIVYGWQRTNDKWLKSHARGFRVGEGSDADVYDHTTHSGINQGDCIMYSGVHEQALPFNHNFCERHKNVFRNCLKQIQPNYVPNSQSCPY
jgi:hypothetical protein